MGNMNKLAYSAAIAALMNSAAAIKSKVDPDVYGPNGENYKHDTASYDLSRIGIDITEPGTGPKCKPGDWVTVHWVGTLKDAESSLTPTRSQEADQRPSLSVLEKSSNSHTLSTPSSGLRF